MDASASALQTPHTWQFIMVFSSINIMEIEAAGGASCGVVSSILMLIQKLYASCAKRYLMLYIYILYVSRGGSGLTPGGSVADLYTW